MKHLYRFRFLLLTISIGMSALFSCSDNDDDAKDDNNAESITIQFSTDEYKVKLGNEIIIEPAVAKAINPIYVWTIDGNIVSSESSFLFKGETLSESFLTLKVIAENGTAVEQVKLSVVDKLPPQISFGAEQVAFLGKATELAATVEYTDASTKFEWMAADGEVISTDSVYVFTGTVVNTFNMSLKVSNMDGVSSINFGMSVLPEPTATLFFDNGRYIVPSEFKDPNAMRKMSVPIGKTLVMAPVKMHMGDNVVYEWAVDGAAQSGVTGEYFNFKPAAQGEYIVSVTGTGTGGTASTKVKVVCTPPEGTYFHKLTESSKYWSNTCFEFIPAPGQFVNYQENSKAEDARLTIHTLVSKNTYPSASYLASIGAFGGYIIFGFDHSVENLDGPDLDVGGNAFAGWGEPGIIWVMQDENGNGLPDDTWYELAGSETGKPTATQRFTMTYFRPSKDNSNIVWIDSNGRTGSIDNNGYHNQKSYFPMFMTEESYTLTGTYLASSFTNNGIEYNQSYDWGYADNINTREGLYLEDAIQQDGSPANLKYIDFIKVHTAQQAKGAAVGEISTEPKCPVDYKMKLKN